MPEINQKLLKRLAGGEATFPVSTTDTITLAWLRENFGDHISGIKAIIAVGGDAVVGTLEENGVDVLTTDKYLGYTTDDSTIPQDCEIIASKYFTLFALDSGVVKLIIE